MDQLEIMDKSRSCRGELLIVDDSAASLAYLSSMLTQASYQVREAPSGELALMTLGVRLPELVLLDVRMPEMDGFELCRRIKANPATEDIPVIFLSAQDESPDKVLGLQVGAVDFIGKSFSPEEMLARIDTHITLSRVKKALKQERTHLEDRVRERTNELSQERQLLMTVVDSGPDWIYATDREHKFLLANRNMATSLGYSDPDDLIGLCDCVAFPRDNCFKSIGDRSCAWHGDELEVLSGKPVYRAQERIALPTGTSIFFETYKSPLRDTENNIYGVLCYRRDITQRLKIEAENRTLERALWQSKKMEAIGQLAGGIAHDFNHLLSLIMGYAQFAQTALSNGKIEKLDGYLTEVLKAGTEGQAVVAQLLAFSRTDEVAESTIDIGPVITETIESLSHAIYPNIDLQLSIEQSLPPVAIKAIQVKQIVTNLVINARDALGSEGSIKVRLYRETISSPLTCRSCQRQFQGNYLTFSIEDNGSGIAPEVIDKIFYPFFTTKDVGNGVGLGLPMVHGIVHSSGGHIQTESLPGKGTRFLIMVPYG